MATIGQPLQGASAGADMTSLQSTIDSQIRRLEEMANGRPTIWSNFNWAEVLPFPTPMTWGIIWRGAAEAGLWREAVTGMGLFFDGQVPEGEMLTLILGRPYINITAVARFLGGRVPLGYDLELMKREPWRASYPLPGLRLGEAEAAFFLLFPYYLSRLTVSGIRMALMRRRLRSLLVDLLIPAHECYVREQRKIDLKSLSLGELIHLIDRWTAHLKHELTRELIMVVFFADLTSRVLGVVLGLLFGEEKGAMILRRLLQGLDGDVTVEGNNLLADIARGRAPLTDFLVEFGHRGPGELELSQPRYHECPELLIGPLEALAPGGVSPAEKHEAARADRQAAEEMVLSAAKGDRWFRAVPFFRRAVIKEMRYAQQYTALRETVKHHFLKSYTLIRTALLELSSRFGMGEEVFYLTPDELPRLVAGGPVEELVRCRKEERELLMRVEPPPVIFSDCLEKLNGHRSDERSEVLRGTPVSGGTVSGPARVFTNHKGSWGCDGTQILVVKSIDPGWAPIFPLIKGLVAEAGGLLSHGAVMAREYGLPAVVNVSGATRWIKEGQRVTVDGDKGSVALDG